MRDLDISILVNSAGVITAGPFKDLTEEEANEMVLVNCITTV